LPYFAGNARRVEFDAHRGLRKISDPVDMGSDADFEIWQGVRAQHSLDAPTKLII